MVEEIKAGGEPGALPEALVDSFRATLTQKARKTNETYTHYEDTVPRCSLARATVGCGNRFNVRHGARVLLM